MPDPDNKPNSQWERLAAAARTAVPTGPAAPPPGFATRVIARAFEAAVPALLRTWHVLSWRFAAASLVALLCGVGATHAWQPEPAPPTADSLTEEVFQLPHLP